MMRLTKQIHVSTYTKQNKTKRCLKNKSKLEKVEKLYKLNHIVKMDVCVCIVDRFCQLKITLNLVCIY